MPFFLLDPYSAVVIAIETECLKHWLASSSVFSLLFVVVVVFFGGGGGGAAVVIAIVKIGNRVFDTIWLASSSVFPLIFSRPLC